VKRANTAQQRESVVDSKSGQGTKKEEEKSALQLPREGNYRGAKEEPRVAQTIWKKKIPRKPETWGKGGKDPLLNIGAGLKKLPEHVIAQEEAE